MRQECLIMGMPITVEVVDVNATQKFFDKVFAYFSAIDERFSTYKPSSEISRINAGKIVAADYSPEMQEVLALCKETTLLTSGFFDIINREGNIDPSGLVKGWAIRNSAALIDRAGYTNFYVEAGGDIAVRGDNADHEPWRVGIRNPFDPRCIVKVIGVSNVGVATSGTYLRGQHVYNPFQKQAALTDIVSMTVVGPDVYEADRFATAAFAMGAEGINFIARLSGFDGYMINAQGIETMTPGFAQYVIEEK